MLNHESGALRVLVTGSRGKSSIVRMLHAGFEAGGLEAWSRITGVVPRQIGPAGPREISRSSGAHVEEMRWWLRSLPVSAQAVVLENSAITPELQPLACRWLQPDLAILSSVLPDHQEAWGDDAAGAADALVAGLQPGGRVILPAGLESDTGLSARLERRRCEAVYAAPAEPAGSVHRAANAGLALAALDHFGLATDAARRAIRDLPPDRFDFRILRHQGAELALAFSVNDITSTRNVFRGLGWPKESTRLVYNHRVDRPGRYRSFREWLSAEHWREVLIIGDRPLTRPSKARYLKLENAASLLRLLQPGERVFGCGNIAGHPLALY